MLTATMIPALLAIPSSSLFVASSGTLGYLPGWSVRMLEAAGSSVFTLLTNVIS
jgi:hypothetical protein